MLFWLVISPFIAAPILAAMGKELNKNVGLAALTLPVILFVYFAGQMPAVVRGDIPSIMYEWVPSIGLNLSLSLDGLSAFFALLITGVGALVILYAHYYLHPTERLTHFYVYLLLFMGAMLGTVTADNLIVLYLFWEITSVSSFAELYKKYIKKIIHFVGLRNKFQQRNVEFKHKINIFQLNIIIT